MASAWGDSWGSSWGNAWGSIAAGPSASIQITGNGTPIADGDATPNVSDHTDFGSATQGAGGVTRTFTVINTGDVDLTFSDIVVPSGFTIVDNLPGSLAVGNSETLGIRLDDSVLGLKEGDFELTIDEIGVFNFKIQGTVAEGAREISVTGNGQAIADGATTPLPGKRTHFGAVALSGSPRTHTFVIHNTDVDVLTIYDVEVPDGFVIVGTQPASVAGGSTANLVVRLDADVAGTKTGPIIVYSNDADEPAYNFDAKGTVYPAAPSPFVYPMFPAPGAVEDTQTLGGTPYDFVDGGVYASGPTGPLLDTIYAFHFYWDNYVVTGGTLYRIASPANAPVKATLSEGFEGVSVLPDLIGPTRGWSQLTLQEDAAASGAAAIALGNLVIANGEGSFITNRVEPDGTRFNSGSQSLRCYCQGATGTATVTKASLSSGLLHFAENDELWAQFYVYIEDGTPLGIIDFECSYMLNSPGLRVLLDGSRIPRVQLKWGTNPDVDGSNPIPADAWVKIRLHYSLTSDTDGVVQMWVNDVLEINGALQTMPLPSAIYDRVQVGVTANTAAAAVLLYVDDIRVARSEAGLADAAPPTPTLGGSGSGRASINKTMPRSMRNRPTRRIVRINGLRYLVDDEGSKK